jgi:hypothetical protein
LLYSGCSSSKSAQRIYVMIGITGAFAGLLALLSDGKGKRIEIFAATAT